ncbi:MAG: hypothetical protein ACFFC7_17475, partial [Candidatus Hermodarchaeota archaeon]
MKTKIKSLNSSQIIGKISIYYPLIISLGILWISIFVLLLLSLNTNQGHLVYALDDPYIHMAIAKNFVKHGIFGVTRHEFTAASSSPLWTLFLSCIYFIFGVNELAPFIINILLASITIILAYSLLQRY